MMPTSSECQEYARLCLEMAEGNIRVLDAEKILVEMAQAWVNISKIVGLSEDDPFGPMAPSSHNVQ